MLLAVTSAPADFRRREPTVRSVLRDVGAAAEHVRATSDRA